MRDAEVGFHEATLIGEMDVALDDIVVHMRIRGIPTRGPPPAATRRPPPPTRIRGEGGRQSRHPHKR
ncbi:MAG: hypothetical protein OXF56_03270, partial [Rhodobacteraceae bacterium]|nr:hypothetical protein [Paracoccaceae bacterium]